MKPNLQVDNEATIHNAQNPEFHRITKYIHLRYIFVQELIASGEITISRVDTEKQLASLLTKPLFATRL